MKIPYQSFALAFGLACLTACGGGKGGETPKQNASKEATNAPDKPAGEEKGKQQDAEMQKKALEACTAYFDALQSGDYEAAGNIFTKKVVQWITVKNTTPKAISKEAKRFLASKKDVKYTIDEESFNLHGSTATFKVRQQWAGYDATVLIEASLDKNYKIFSYIERKAVFKKKNVSLSNLEAFLKKIPMKKLPQEFNTGEEYPNLSDVGMRVLYPDAESSKMMKEGMQNGIVRAQECFWFSISPDVVGIVSSNGGRIIMFTLTTFNRKTGEKIDEEIIGSVGTFAQISEYSNVSFNADFSIETHTHSVTPEYDAEGNMKEEPKAEERVYMYKITPNGGIHK